MPCLKIKDIELDSSVMLAPMAGYTDTVFRCLVRSFGGVGLAFSEMVNPRSALYGGGNKRDAILACFPEDTPLSWQIYGGPSEPLAEAAQWLVERGATMLDINMGCPKRKITGRAAGAGILKDPDSAVKLVESVVRSVSVPVTVKIRSGWKETILDKNDFIPRIEMAGAAAITVHPRSAMQGYSGSADWRQIKLVVDQVKIPVIGSGDITSPEDGVRMMNETGCAGFMIGRAALKLPWLLRDTYRMIAGLPSLPTPSIPEIFELMKVHFEATVKFHGDEMGAVLFRKWIPFYAKSLMLNKETMVSLIRTQRTDDLRFRFSNLTIVPEKAEDGAEGNGC
ncbi:MAG: tRNA dihydrouridine synthase DusB [Lentisphaerae bacterium]|nr:tRNA dihydrouridine synthase DusB [Lentisphaerota bacterium]